MKAARGAAGAEPDEGGGVLEWGDAMLPTSALEIAEADVAATRSVQWWETVSLVASCSFIALAIATYGYDVFDDARVPSVILRLLLIPPTLISVWNVATNIIGAFTAKSGLRGAIAAHERAVFTLVTERDRVGRITRASGEPIVTFTHDEP